MDIEFQHPCMLEQNLKYPMGMGMRIDFENLMSMTVDMGMNFENVYGCGYSSTCLIPAPSPSLGGRQCVKGLSLCMI